MLMMVTGTWYKQQCASIVAVTGWIIKDEANTSVVSSVNAKTTASGAPVSDMRPCGAKLTSQFCRYWIL